MSDIEKVQLVAIAVALVVLHENNARLLQLLANRRANKRPATFARHIVETLFDSADRSQGTLRKLSAWAIAVGFLVKTQVPPSTIEALSLNSGEGIDAWARKGAKRRVSASGRHQVVKPATVQPATVVIKVGKDRKRFSISDKSVLAGIEQELTRLQASYPGPKKLKIPSPS